jgi:hypothetical protein
MVVVVKRRTIPGDRSGQRPSGRADHPSLLVSYNPYVPHHSGNAANTHLFSDHPLHDGSLDREYSIWDDDLDLECPTPRTETYWNSYYQMEVTEVRTYHDRYKQSWLPVRCNRNGCPACGILNARRIAWAIWLSQPDYALTLTLVGPTKEIAIRRINKFVAALREIYPTLEYTCQIEPNPGDTGNHAHLYIHVADRNLRRSIIKGRWKHLAYLTRLQPGTTVRYLGYPMKDLADPHHRDAYLVLNGVGRKQSLVHASPGFWRDGRGGPTMRPWSHLSSQRHGQSLREGAYEAE